MGEEQLEAFAAPFSSCPMNCSYTRLRPPGSARGGNNSSVLTLSAKFGSAPWFSRISVHLTSPSPEALCKGDHPLYAAHMLEAWDAQTA